MSKVNQSAGDTASATSTATLRAVPASSSSAESARAARLFDEIVQLSMANQAILDAAIATGRGDESEWMVRGSLAVARQIGFLADYAGSAFGDSTMGLELEAWIVPASVRTGGRHD